MDSVKVVVVKDGTYQDAKDVAKELSKSLEGWQLEGGAHNIARRDGIGSLILDSYEKIGRLPDHYFQAVGGGPGPIGVYEMMQRLIDSGHYEGEVARIHLSQNPSIVLYTTHGKENLENSIPKISQKAMSRFILIIC